MSEHDEQVSLFQWAEIHVSKYPDLASLFAIPNGGERHPAVARKLQKEGVKPGVPDIFLAVPRGRFHGLYIEMKFGKNKTSHEQRDWLARLSRNGYAVRVAWSCESAKRDLITYMNLGKT